MSVTYIVLLSMAYGIGAVAFVLAWSANRKSPRGQRKRIEELELLCCDLDERLASLLQSHKKLNSRVAMRQARAARADHDKEDVTQLPGESDIEWKTRMRKLIARGKLTHSTDSEIVD